MVDPTTAVAVVDPATAAQATAAAANVGAAVTSAGSDGSTAAAIQTANVLGLWEGVGVGGWEGGWDGGVAGLKGAASQWARLSATISAVSQVTAACEDDASVGPTAQAPSASAHSSAFGAQPLLSAPPAASAVADAAPGQTANRPKYTLEVRK